MALKKLSVLWQSHLNSRNVFLRKAVKQSFWQNFLTTAMVLTARTAVVTVDASLALFFLAAQFFLLTVVFYSKFFLHKNSSLEHSD